MTANSRDWPVVTASIESEMYRGTSPHRVTYGVTRGDGQHYGGDGREIGHLSGACREPASDAWRERNEGRVPMTRLWLRLDPRELAKLPGVREAVLETAQPTSATA